MSQLESLKSNFCESDPNSNIETVIKDVYNKKISELLKNKLAKLQRLNPSSNKNASDQVKYLPGLMIRSNICPLVRVRVSNLLSGLGNNF